MPKSIIRYHNVFDEINNGRPLTVYQFLYNPCIHESGSVTVSLHLTKKGAWGAMKSHKLERYTEWLRNPYKHFRITCIFGRHESWRIEPIEIKP